MIGEKIKNYEITARLGAGGMGEVFLATDTRLDRQVALKFLPREIASDPDRRQRLELEAKTASSLDHPNILTIYEIDEHDGRPFIAMAYVEGCTLKDKLGLAKPSLEDAVRFGVQIASALGAAHAKGIIHRDVKPDNILIDKSDRARLTDFGLAKLKESSGLTGRGTTVGTVGYMSPEQAQGQPVDARSDVFSLGVVLYELLTGKRPFVAEHAAAALYSIVHEDPTPIREISPDVPEPLSQVVERALAKSPGDRYADAGALDHDLRLVARELEFSRISSGAIAISRPPKKGRLAWFAAGVLIIGLGLILAISPTFFESETVEVKASDNSLAVMYFENLSDPGDNERLGDIITELLTTDLSGSEYVTVISTQRLHDLYKQEGGKPSGGASRDMASKVARKAGAARMLSGTLSKLGGRTVITAQLVDVGSGDVVGSERVDGTDVFAVVDDLSTKIKRKLGLTEAQVADGEFPIAEATTSSRDAYRHYLHGMDAYYSLEWPTAHAYFDSALAADSGFTLAYVRKGIAFFSDGHRDRGMEMLAAARKHMDRVKGSDRLLVQAFAVDMGVNLDTEATLKTLKRATTAYPTNKEAFFWVANFLSYEGRDRDSALHYAQAALALDPDYPFALLVAANLYNTRKQYAEARAVAARYLRQRPDDVVPYLLLAEISIQLDQLDSAMALSRTAIRVAPEQRQGYASVAQVFVLDGQPDSAIATYERMMTIDNNPFTTILAHGRIGMVHRSWGQFNQAVDQYERATEVADVAGMTDRMAQNNSALGSLYLQTGRFDAALERFQKATSLDSLDESGTLGRARVYAQTGRGNDATTLLAEMKERWGQRIDSATMRGWASEIRGRAALANGRYAEAIDWIKDVRISRGDSSLLCVVMADAMIGAGDLDGALAELAACRQDMERDWPSADYLRALYLQAKALVANGQADLAQEPLERFLVFWGNADWDAPIIADARNLYQSISAQ